MIINSTIICDIILLAVKSAVSIASAKLFFDINISSEYVSISAAFICTIQLNRILACGWIEMLSERVRPANNQNAILGLPFDASLELDSQALVQSRS